MKTGRNVMVSMNIAVDVGLNHHIRDTGMSLAAGITGHMEIPGNRDTGIVKTLITSSE